MIFDLRVKSIKKVRQNTSTSLFLFHLFANFKKNKDSGNYSYRSYTKDINLIIFNLEQSDKILLKGCLKGDRNAQKALYEKFKVPMFRICLRYANDRPEAEDMLQEGFVKVFLDLHQFRKEGPLGGWIRRVIVNVALMQIRKRRKLFSNVEVENLSDSVTTDEDVFAEMNAKALTRIIQKLPTGYRVVFNMYVIEGYSHKEIAEKLEVSVNTSKSQLSKAKATLRKMLEKCIVG
jgi:RNA polymerase sigma factor (sigma-70 family)